MATKHDYSKVNTRIKDICDEKGKLQNAYEY